MIIEITLLSMIITQASYMSRQNRAFKKLNRKLNFLLRSTDIPSSEASSPEPIYKKFKALMAEGKTKEAKALAKEELIDPAEFRHVGLR